MMFRLGVFELVTVLVYLAFFAAFVYALICIVQAKNNVREILEILKRDRGRSS